MSYSPDSFSAFETPTLAKWGKLWSNDASFHDGTGIDAGVITPEKLVSGAGTSWAYSSRTPTFTNFTLGNGTVVARYRPTGKRMHEFGYVTLGSTSSMSTNPRISLQSTALATGYVQNLTRLGNASLKVPASSDVLGSIYYYDTTTAAIYYNANNPGDVSILGAITSTTPFSPWATGYQIGWDFGYEIA